MSDDELHELVKRHGATGKLVRAICTARGWRWTPQGAPPEWHIAYRGSPPEWHIAYRGSLGGQLETLLQCNVGR
jgi:hypothetical protein